MRTANSESYQEMGLAVVRAAIEPPVIDFLATYVNLLGHIDILIDDPQVPGTQSIYGDPAFDTALARLIPLISEVVGVQLLPSYSYVRVYRQGCELARHMDRAECEHSATVHLSSQSGIGSNWPVEAESLGGQAMGIELEAGDALVYRGCEVPHWRRPCPDEWYAQIFFHFVAASGPYADRIFDGRPYLGLASSTRTA